MNIKEARVMGYFIEATQKLIKKDGIENLTIKKIADMAGYNSATIYNYFQNLDVLILYSSIGSLNTYILALKKATEKIDNPITLYKEVYRLFNLNALSEPQLYYNIFYGEHSNNLPEIMKNYYEIFPDELKGITDVIKNMLSQGDIYFRDMALTQGLVDEGFMSEENRNYLVETMIRNHMAFLKEIIIDKRVGSKEELQKDFMDFIDKTFELLLEK